MRLGELHFSMEKPILTLPIPAPFFEIDKPAETVLFQDTNLFPINISDTGIDFLRTRGEVAKYLYKIVELSEEVLSENHALAVLSLSAERGFEDAKREALVVRFSVFNMPYSQILDMWDVVSNRIQKAVPTETLKDLVLFFDHARPTSKQQSL